MLHRLDLNLFRYFYLLNILITSCSPPSPAEELSTIIIPDRIDSTLYLADMSNSINQIQLETNEHALLGEIKDVKLFNNKLYINNGRQVLVFKDNGYFISKLGGQGEGPGEYGIVNSMAVDVNESLIYISSVNKLIVFSEDHKLIKEKKYPMLLPYITFVDNHLLIISDQIVNNYGHGFTNNTTLYKVGSDLTVNDSTMIRKVTIDEKKSIGYNYKFFLSSNGSGNYFYKPVLTQQSIFPDTLYQVDGVKLTPHKQIVFEQSQKLDPNGYITPLMLNVINSTSYIVCEYMQDTKRMFFIYNKDTSKNYNIENGILDQHGIPVILRPLDLANNIFYYIKQEGYGKGLKEESNPIIGIVTLY